MTYEYGLWLMVALNVGLGMAFVVAYFRPTRPREWRSFGVTTAFVVALFTEMYGFPLTIYLLTAALGHAPFPDPFAHSSGNLIASLLGLGDGWATAFMLLGGLVFLPALLIVASSWRRVHAADGGLVTDGPYAVVRHPQYSGLMLAVLGALIQWPTLITVLMAPVLVFTYYRLARREEREMAKRFGEEYDAYRARTPMLVPRWPSGKRAQTEPAGTAPEGERHD